MKKRPPAAGLSPQLAAFLATPVRLPPATASLNDLTKSCKRVVDELLIQAFREKLLPRGTLGVVYLSLEPKTGELVLRNDLLWWGDEKPEHHRALVGYAYAAHFNREKKSFFHRIPRNKRSRSGWIGLFSSGIGKPLLLPELNSIHFDFQIKSSGDFSFLDSVSLKPVESPNHDNPPPPRIFDFGCLVSNNEIIFKTPPSAAKAKYTVNEHCEMGANESGPSSSEDWLDKKTFDEFVRGYAHKANRQYFDHICSGIQNSHYLMCAPELLSFQPQSVETTKSGQIHTGAETGVGFILDRNVAIDESTLRTCHWIAYKIGLVSPLRWLAEVKMRDEVERENDFFLEAAAHVLLGPIDMCQKWLDRAPKELTSNTYIERARASLGKEVYNAETLLQLANLRASGKAVELTETDVIACVREVFEKVTKAYSLLNPKLRATFHVSPEIRSVQSHDRILRIAVTEALRNACDEIVLNNCYGDNRAKADVELRIDPMTTEGTGLVISVENTWSKPDAATIRQLNQRPLSDTKLRGHRKGSDHFGVGTTTLCRLVEKDFLRGSCQFSMPNNRFRCEIRLPAVSK